jgi:hypothetical protein
LAGIRLLEYTDATPIHILIAYGKREVGGRVGEREKQRERERERERERNKGR